jgi:hypothetical protein
LPGEPPPTRPGDSRKVGLILMASLLMVGMVVAMKGFNERRT